MERLWGPEHDVTLVGKDEGPRVVELLALFPVPEKHGDEDRESGPRTDRQTWRSQKGSKASSALPPLFPTQEISGKKAGKSALRGGKKAAVAVPTPSSVAAAAPAPAAAASARVEAEARLAIRLPPWMEIFLPRKYAWLQFAYHITMIYLFTFKLHWVPEWLVSPKPEKVEKKK